MSPPVTIRGLRDEDVGYIVDTWRKGIEREKEYVSWLRRWSPDVFFRLMEKHIKAVLHEAGANVRVACDPSDADTIVGFVVLTGSELHYIYVRQTLWKQGIARLLLDGVDVRTYSFRTASGMGRLRPQDRGWEYKARKLVAGDGRIQVEMG